ncbi:type II toxin-antitoxin system VapC family toxin [Rhodobacteraceae bacterium ASV31]|nr:type II toxin-antitoxin system VapC family toxin [Anianabacter salinae]
MVVDTSALIAILLDEPEASACLDMMRQASRRCISAGTLQEFLIVADLRGVGDAALRLVDRLVLDVLPVDEARAHLAAKAYRSFGKGLHPARLNLADCFSYALARDLRCPLLFIGDDFPRTDIGCAI